MIDLSLPRMQQLGKDRGRGNLLGIEPYMVAQDYATEESLFEKLNSYLLAAQAEQYLGNKTIVLFPEYIGSWLVLAGESTKTFQSRTLESAERAMVFSHPLKFISSLLRSRERGRAEAAFFRMKAPAMAEIYSGVFSQLARQHSVTIIAGSIVLPAPEISGRRLISHNGPLYNASVVYGPDGVPYPSLIRKAFPTARELAFTAPAPAPELPSFETPAGRLGVLICADSWFPQAYAPLKEQEVDMLAVPSYSASGGAAWNQPWPGYDGWQAPGDVDRKDVKKITEGQAWNKYALAGRIRSSGATYGINVFLRGKFWDQDWGGWPATLVRGEDVYVEPQTLQAAVMSLWL